MNNEEKSAFVKFQERTFELAGGNKNKVEFANKLAELELDFEFVKDLNTQLANKYQELMECFPTVKELDIVINKIEDDHLINNPIGSNQDQSRLIKLKKFKSALVALEKQDPTAKPQRYDELINQEKDEKVSKEQVKK